MFCLHQVTSCIAHPRSARICRFALLRSFAAAAAPRPPRSGFLQGSAPQAPQTPSPSAGTPSTQPGGQQQVIRYGPADIHLQPKDQLRPLLPTWNPPPTRRPTREEMILSERMRFKFEDRWWAATLRGLADDDHPGQVRVGFDGWPSRHDEWVPLTTDRLYLHESHHPEYEAPPIPKRFTRESIIDSQGPVPEGERKAPKAVRVKPYDPEKERLKRLLRPPLPYNPEKERLKRVLRGQYAPPIEAYEAPRRDVPPVGFEQETQSSAAQAHVDAAPAQAAPVHQTPPETRSQASPRVSGVEWEEVPGAPPDGRQFRHVPSGRIHVGVPPSGWAELISPEAGPDGRPKRYYWHVGRNETTWERPQ